MTTLTKLQSPYRGNQGNYFTVNKVTGETVIRGWAYLLTENKGRGYFDPLFNTNTTNGKFKKAIEWILENDLILINEGNEHVGPKADRFLARIANQRIDETGLRFDIVERVENY